jgi:FG-GAP repeat.
MPLIHHHSAESSRPPKAKSFLCKFLLLCVYALMMSQAAYAVPTTLVAGDIAILGLNADDTAGSQRWAFVTLRDIGSGTVIHFTDASYDASISSSSNRFYTAGNNEGFMTWTVIDDVAAGKLLVVTNNGAGNASMADKDGNAVSGLTGSLGTSTNTAFLGTGDQIFAYQGISGTTVGATFIYGINTGQNGTNYTNGAWISTGSISGQQFSYIPDGLTNGTTAVALTSNSLTGSSSGAGTFGFDNMRYNGITSGTQSALLAAIGNPTNWVGDNTTPYNLATSDNFTLPQPVPSITSATYNASNGALSVTGTNFAATAGTFNDVIANKFAITAEGGSIYTLTNTVNAEIDSSTNFTLNLSETDRRAVNQIINKNGTASTGGTTYNLAGAAGFIAASAATADTTGNGITVSNVAVPTITSAAYDADGGVLYVTGGGFLKINGPTNDIVANKFTFTGQGGSTYTLTDTANVEIASDTAFALTLSATDKAGVNAVLNKNGTTSTGGTTYNLAAAEDWAAGADAAVVVADTTGNGIIVSNAAITTTLATSPTLIFTRNGSDITGDNIATDGEGGSVVITDIDIQIFNISDTDGTPTEFLSWENNDDFLVSSDSTFSALTYNDGVNGATKGMAIKSGDGSEFRLVQFTYYNWGETEPQPGFELPIISAVGYRDGVQVASTTFAGYNEEFDPTIITFDASFANIDDVRIFISAGGYAGDQSYTNHAINNIQVAPPEVDTQPPAFQNSTPSIGNINTNSAVLTVRLDEVGTAYYVVVPDGATAPSSTQVIAGQNSSGAAAVASGSISAVSAGVDYVAAIAGLSAGTAYDVYVVAQDNQSTSNVQASPTLVNLTTSTANALYFDTDAKVTGLTGISPAAFTVEFNLFLDSETPAGNWQGIYWTNNNNDTGIFIEDNYAVSLWTTQSTAYKSTVLLTYGAWNHVAISYSAGNGVRMYINGVLSGVTPTGSPGAGVLPLTDVTIGYGPGNFGLPAGGYALGDSALDDFRIWNVERTLQQINDNRGAELAPPYPANLVRYYDFNHGVGGANNAGITTLIERTGNGANGTLANFALNGGVSNWVETSSLVSTPTVTDANISISGASGTGGAFKIGDTVTATWNNSATGDNNSGITDVTVDFSQFGGGTAVSATEVSGIWTATYTIVAGSITATNRNVSVTVSGATGQTTRSDTANAPVDSSAPTASIVVSDTALSVGETTTVTITFSEAVTGLDIADFTVANGGLSSLSSSDGGITWAATLTPSAATQDSSNLITLDNTAYADLAGNTGTGTSDSNNYAIDTLRPTATIVVANTALAAGETSLVTITFNEAITGFTTADLTVANGTLSSVSSSDGGTTWTATLTPTAGVEDPSNLITLNNTGVTDAAGNAGSGSTDSNNYAIDSLRPTASLVVSDTALVDGQTTTLTITFSEAISGLTIDDLVADNAALSVLSSSDGGITWTATLTPDAAVDEATNVVTLTNTGVADAAGNTGLGTTSSNNYAIDSAAPSVVSVSVPADTTYMAGQTLTFTVNTSENVTVDTTGGTPQLALTIGATSRNAAFASGSGTSALVFSYTVQAGDVDDDGIAVGALSANGGTLKDAAGNDMTLTLNSVADTAGVLVDAVLPALVNLSPADDATGVAPTANLVITLDEDIALGAGTIAVYDSDDVLFASIDVTNHDGQLSIDGTALTIDLSANLIEDVSYYVLIDGGAITDLAGNAFAGVADPASWSFAVADISPPTVTSITVAGSPAANAAAIQFTVTFDEVPANISVGDFTLTPSSGAVSGSIASHSPVNLNTVTVTIDQITGTGTLRLDVNANSGITDTLGNGDGTNGYVAAFTSGDLHTVDREAPVAPATPTLESGSDTGDSDSDGITNAATPTITGTAEPNAVLTVTSSLDGVLGTATANGSGNWSFTPSTALTEATHFITVTATDGAGNVSNSSANLTLQLDISAPSGHSATFVESVLNVGNSTAAGFNIAAGEAGATYSYTISSAGGGAPVTGTGTISSAPQAVTGLNLSGLGDGALTLSLVLTDAAGNAAAAVTAGATLDTALPGGHSVSFATTDLNSGNASAVSFSFADAEVGATYSYTITSSGGGTPVTGNGTLSSANQTVSGIDLRGLADGTLTLSVVVGDASGNSAPAVTANANLDQTIPSVILSSAAGATVNSAFTATIAFSESVNNFVVGDITAGNAILSGFTDNGGGSYSVTVTPTADGIVTLNVAANVAQDAAGNNNTAATELSRTYDGTAPNLSSSNPADGASNVAGDADLVLTFSEPVVAGSGNLTLFDAADDSVVEAFAVGSVTISSNVVTLNPASTLTPTHSYYLQIASTALVDAAGNAYAGINDATTLNFTVINTAPVANADTGTVAEDAAVSLTVLGNDTDADSALNLASVTVVTAPQHGSTNVNTGTGVITYTPASNYNGADSFTYTVEDVYGSLSNVATVAITVTPVNDAPVAVADTASTPEDNAVSIDVAGNDTDIDAGDSVDSDSIVIVSAPAHGSASLVNGEVLYTPTLDFNGSDSFTYTIQDQNGATSNVATVIINVTGINDLPTAAADSATVAEDGSVDIAVLANDSDVDGSIDPTTVVVLANASHGTASVDALTGEITYTPDANFHGTDTFTYVVQDDDGGTSNAATVTVTVTSVNDAPVANADVAVLQEDTALSINVLGNDSDMDGTLVPASVEVVGAPVNGTAQVNAVIGAIVYTPGENFSGGDSFTYRVQDNEGAWSAPATVTITVEAVNDEPLANDDAAVTDEDTAVAIDLLANDNDVDGVLDPASLVFTQPVKGTLTDNGDGTVTYTPEADFFGTDSFTYTVADDEGGLSNSATVTVTINPINDAPVISGTPAVSVNQDSAYSFTPIASDVDPNTTLTFSIANQPDWASFNTATGALTGTPGNDDVGDYNGIVITVSDGLLNASLPAFAITVVDINDAPQVGGSTPLARINQDGSYSFVPEVVDVDGDTLTFTVNNLPQWANFDPATGAITGTPGNNDVGTYDNIVISVSDGTTTTVLDSFSITVANVNDPPVIVADSYELSEGGLLQPNANAGILANDYDIDGDNLIAVLVNGPRNASEFSLSEDGSFRYLHNGSETRVDSFTYRISDNTINSAPVTVSLTIVPVNDAPVFITQPVLAVAEGTAYRYEVGVADPDSVVTLSLGEGAPEWLTLSGFRLSGTAPVNVTDPVQVVLRASDGQYTVDQTFNLAVLSQEVSLVNISTSWLGLPSIVDNTVDLQITLTHVAGPALPDANLRVALQGLDVASSMANCTMVTSGFSCSTTLNTDASRSFRLRVTPREAGNLVVNLAMEAADGSVIARGITDVSATPRAVSQGNVSFSLANATALASINLLNDGTRELIAGTSLGDTVKLLDYSLSSGTARIIGEIENRGYTERVRVADIDRDGLEDIVVVNRSGDLGAVYYDRGGEFLEEPSNQKLAHAREALLSDLNGDDYPELILGADGFNLYIYENNEGVYDQAPLVFTSPASILHFALLRRLPTDAPLEGTLVISSAEAVQLVRFGLNPDGGVSTPEGEEGTDEAVSQKFELLQSIAIPGVSSVQLVDVDGDGREEIVVSTTHEDNSADASGVTVIEVTQNGQLQIVARLGAASAERVEVADFNNDGRPDLLVANSNNSYQFYRGTGSATDWTLTDTILYHRSTLMIPEDINGDGLADVLVYEEGEEQVELYLSAPDGDTGETADLTLNASTRVVRNDRYHFEYAVEVRNEGGFVAENPRVVVPLPQGIDVVNLPSYCNEDAEVDEVTCNLQDLGPGSGQIIPLILAGDRRTDGITLTAHATSDALEMDTADNTVSTTLNGLFQYRHARIKGGGGSVSYTWFAALFGLAFGRRRRAKQVDQTGNKKIKIFARKAAAVVLPLCLATAIQPSEVAAQSPANSYIEGNLGLISSDWDMMTFYYDLAGSTQAAALVEKDDQRFGWQLLYGYRVHPRIALEVGYLNSGETSLEVDAVVSDTEALRQVLRDHAPVSGEGPYAGVRFSMFSRQEQELYAKVGLWSWSSGYTLSVGDQTEWVKRSDQDWIVGLGFSLPVMEKLRLGGNIQSSVLGDDRIVFIGLNLSYHFDVKRQ